MVKVWSEDLDKVIDIATQVAIPADADPGGAWLEQMACVDGPQMLVALGLKCHLRQYAHAQSQFDIRLDHIGVYRRQARRWGSILSRRMPD